MDLEEMGKEMMDQDRAGTASPYIVALQEKVPTQVGPDQEYDKRIYYSSWLECEFDTIEELEAQAKENGSDVCQVVRESTLCHIKYKWEDRNWFFTRKALEVHVKQNKHRYGETRSYVYHCFRNPEMEAVQNHFKEMALTSDKVEVANYPDIVEDVCYCPIHAGTYPADKDRATGGALTGIGRHWYRTGPCDPCWERREKGETTQDVNLV
jgi:hypothetical protein